MAASEEPCLSEWNSAQWILDIPSLDLYGCQKEKLKLRFLLQVDVTDYEIPGGFWHPIHLLAEMESLCETMQGSGIGTVNLFSVWEIAGVQ
jgi:hypothetical protein